MIEIVTTEGIAIMFRQLRKTFVARCLLLLAGGTLSLECHVLRGDDHRHARVPYRRWWCPDGTITVGDKTFTNFTYYFTGDMPPAHLRECYSDYG